MKTKILSVDLTVELPDNVDPSAVTFEIPIEAIRVDAEGKRGIGRVTSYCTQENFD